MGMSDLQFKAFLKGIVSDLEYLEKSINAMNTTNTGAKLEAEEILAKMIRDHKETLQG